MTKDLVSITFSHTKPKQPVKKVLEDIDALLEELLDEKDDSLQLKVNDLIKITLNFGVYLFLTTFRQNICL